MKQYVFPKKIIGENAEQYSDLLVKQDMQIGLAESKVCYFKKGDSVILDFGMEICGGVRVLTFLGENVPVRIRFGESLTECCANIGEKNATNDHSIRDFTVHLQNYSDMTFGQTGFRFVRLDFENEIPKYIKLLGK